MHDPNHIPDPNAGDKTGSPPSPGLTPQHTTISQGGAKEVHAEQVTVRQGGIVLAKTDQLHMTMGGIVAAQTNAASLTASESVFMAAAGDVAMDQSGAGVLVAGGHVKMDHSGAGAVIAREVTVEKSSTFLLLAGNVTGDVKAAFNQRDSILFGAIAGTIAGLAMLGLSLSRRERDRSGDGED